MKMKRILSLVLATLLTVTLLTVFGMTLVGASESVETIESEAEFLAMTDGNYKLGASITLTSTLPSFTGTLDGGGYTVTVFAPIFNTLSGEVKNLTIEGAITGDSTTAAGALANTVGGDLVLDGITASVNINLASADYVGGLLGKVTGLYTVTVTDCHNTANVIGGSVVGGLVGGVISDTSTQYTTLIMTNVSNRGNVHSTKVTGNVGTAGILGYVGKGGEAIITQAVNYGKITMQGGDAGVGGIFGGTSWSTDRNEKITVSYSANFGDVFVSGAGQRGRAAGIAARVNKNGALIQIDHCYNTGTISAMESTSDGASGIFGYAGSGNIKGSITNCYNVGVISAKGDCVAIGAIGDKNITGSDNYYIPSTPAEGSTALAGTDGTYKANVASASVADAAALKTKLCEGEDPAYVIDPAVHESYPILTWQCTHSGTKTSSCLGDVCNICGAKTNTTSGAHEWKAWEETKKPTVTDNGEEVRKCKNCDEVETRETDAEGKIAPDFGIYTVTSENHLLWLIANLNNGSLPADLSVELGKDIALTNGNDTVTATFTGSFNGRGYTLSGITNTLFKQLNGSFENVTLKGSIDYTEAANNKAASVAMNGQDVVIRNVTSEINIKSKGGNANIGGILGYGKGSVILLDVTYAGNLDMSWTSTNAGIGGIVGWINTNGKTTAIENCRFTGKLTLSVESTGEVDVGGIVGHAGSSSAAAMVVGCVNTGSITIKPTTSEKVYVGGIVGKFNDNDASYIKRCVVNGSAMLSEKASYGSLLGRTTNKTGYLLENCAVLNEGAAFCSVADATKIVNCFNKNTVQKIGSPFTREGVSYQKYNFGYLNTETLQCVDPASIPAPSFSPGTLENLGNNAYKIATDDFTSFLSSRQGKTNGTHDIRFVIAADFITLKTNKHLYLTVTFMQNGSAVRSLRKELVKDLDVYYSATAAGNTYTAGTGDVLFGIVITDVPDNAWNEVTVTLDNEEIGVAAGKSDKASVTEARDAKFTSFKIADTAISSYKIVYAESEFDLYASVSSLAPLYPKYDFNRETAERLRDLIYAVTGERLAVVKDTDTKESDYEILIGITNRRAVSTKLSLDAITSDQYLIDAEGKTLVICGGEYGTTWHAIDYLETLFTEALASGKTAYTFPSTYSHSGIYRLTRIGCIGDSITQGTGSSNQALYSYPAQLGRLLWKDAIVSNYGKSGSTMRSDLADAYTKREAYTNALNAAKNTDLFIIMLGTNDSNRDQNWTDASSTKYNDSCLAIVKALADKNSDLQFILANCPTYFGDRAFGSDTILALQSALVTTLNQKGYPTTLFDMHTVTANMGEYFPDDLHPNDMGYCLMAQAFKTALEESLIK